MVPQESQHGAPLRGRPNGVHTNTINGKARNLFTAQSQRGDQEEKRHAQCKLTISAWGAHGVAPLQLIDFCGENEVTFG